MVDRDHASPAVPLFALTYNGHRIHYDRDYAREVEGYPGLVTHGPLQALAMAEAARARGLGTACAYRLVAPLFEHQGLVVSVTDSGEASVHDRSGREPPAPRSHDPRATLPELRAQVRALCAEFPNDYWRARDQAREYPQAFVDALTESRLLAALIPAGYGGLGLSLTEASVIMEEINRSGGHSAACHAQMYTMGAVLRHGSDAQKREYLPAIAGGELRLQAFSITEAQAGSDTKRIRHRAPRRRRVRHRRPKNWTSRIEQSDLLLLLARTSADGLSLFLIDLRAVPAEALEITPVRTMFNYATNQVRYRGLRVPASSLIGEEGQGFRYVIDGWNAERILLAAEAIGDGYWFTERATAYANEREVFGRPIGVNQGVQFPIAHA